MTVAPPLVEIRPPAFDVDIFLAYATERNFTGSSIYARAGCYLRPEGAEALRRAIELAAAVGYRIKVFDALRPIEAQWMLWNHTPDPNFLADPRRGSPHSRGVAIDLTLLDRQSRELPMGTQFDAFTPLSHHGNCDIPPEAQINRHLLLGIMSAAGWDFYRNEWWHYQLFDARAYPLIQDSDLPTPMMR